MRYLATNMTMGNDTVAEDRQLGACFKNVLCDRGNFMIGCNMKGHIIRCAPEVMPPIYFQGKYN
jgi:hypothetical protein